MTFEEKIIQFRQDGWEQGRTKGMLEGILIGDQSRTRQLAKYMLLKLDLPMEKVQEATGLSIDELKGILES